MPCDVVTALCCALDEAARALEEGDALSAQVAMGKAGLALREAEKARVRLPPATVESLRVVHARCLLAATGLSHQIASALQQMGASRRAACACV